MAGVELVRILFWILGFGKFFVRWIAKRLMLFAISIILLVGVEQVAAVYFI